MVNYGKKFGLITLLSLLPTLYAMENGTSGQNIMLQNAIISAQNNNFSDEQDWKNIQHYLEQGADPNATGELGKPLLVLIIEHSAKNKEMFARLFHYLLEKGADPNCCSSNGITPLHILAYPSIFDVEIATELLRHKANPNSKTTICEETPLSWTAMHGNSTMIKLLLEYNAKINEKTPKATALYFTIAHHHDEAIKILLEAGALLTGINDDMVRATAFHVATREGLPKKYIEALITHACFDSYKEIINPEIEKAIITIGCICNQFGLPWEIYHHIISILPPTYFDSTKGLCQKLLRRDYEHPYLCAQVNQRIAQLNKIFQIKDNFNKLASSYCSKSYYDADKIRLLLNGQKLQKDFKAFNENFPAILYLESAKDNLVCEMYRNCDKLLQQNKAY